MKNIRFVTLGIIFIIISCKDTTIEPNVAQYQNIDNVEIDDFSILNLDYNKRPYTMSSLAKPDQNPNPTDSNGIQVFIYNGKTYYHPLNLAQKMEWYLDSFYQTSDPLYLSWVLRYYYKLMDIGTVTDKDLYFTYPFDFDLHGYSDQTMIAPWLSGLTQGVVLKVLTRLYEFTGDKRYLEDATKVFNSFNRIANKDNPWISMVDENNYYWIEEYPDNDAPNFTLNGFIFCVFGLYEYYQVTKDEYSEYLLKASLTTIKHYANAFRVKGEPSYYRLKHKVQNERYHRIHIKQFKGLYTITGDQFFADFADSLYHDFH